MCFMIEQLLRTAASPPRGVQQACLCSRHAAFFFPKACVGLLFCVHLARCLCLQIMGSLYKNVPKHTAVKSFLKPNTTATPCSSRHHKWQEPARPSLKPCRRTHTLACFPPLTVRDDRKSSGDYCTFVEQQWKAAQHKYLFFLTQHNKRCFVSHLALFNSSKPTAVAI